MKPFDLEAALRGEAVVTRDGREVTQLVRFDQTKSSYPLRGVIAGEICAWSSVGHAHGGGRSCSDLFMAPKKCTVWMNMYVGAVCRYGIAFHSEEEANSRANPGRIGGRAWPLEIEE